MNELVEKLQVEVEAKTKKMKDMTTDLMIQQTNASTNQMQAQAEREEASKIATDLRLMEELKE